MQWQQTVVKKEPWAKRVTDQPHQLLFVFGILWGVFTMIATFFSLIGKDIDFALYHGLGIYYGLFTNAFLGFLLTVIPRYTSSEAVPAKLYLPLIGSLQVALVVLFFADQFVGKMLITASLLFASYIFAITIKKGRYTHKSESKWLTVAMFAGAIGVWADHIAIFWYYLAVVVFVVGARMIPAFYAAVTNIPPSEKPSWFHFPFIAAFWTIATGYQLDIPLLVAIGSIAGAIMVGYFLLSIKVWVKAPAIFWILPLGLVWFEAGLIFLAIEQLFGAYTYKLAYHAAALGTLLTLLVGFGTRVIQGHSNQRIYADKFAIFIFIFAQVVIISRITASLLFVAESPAFNGFVHLAAWGWIVLFVLWGFRHGKTLLRIEK